MQTILVFGLIGALFGCGINFALSIKQSNNMLELVGRMEEERNLINLLIADKERFDNESKCD